MWRDELRRAVRCPTELLRLCGLSREDITIDSAPAFKVYVPPRWLARIVKHSPQDPLLLQVLSDIQELDISPGYCDDPLQEKQHTFVEGLLHKYPHRVLIITTAACPIHCRYCFRRHFPYEDHQSHGIYWQHIIQHIRSMPEIYEVILSGGDPLMLSDERLQLMLQDIKAVPGVRKIRIHTRFATTVPARFSEEFWAMLTPYAHMITWVWHINHAQELGEDVHAVARTASSLGMRVLSQSVLLRGINDTIETLSNLMWALDAHGIAPYYMHQVDRVHGAGHYEVNIQQGWALMETLRGQLPGYLVPQYVKEIPGQKSKTPLTPLIIEGLISEKHSAG